MYIYIYYIPVNHRDNHDFITISSVPTGAKKLDNTPAKSSSIRLASPRLRSADTSSFGDGELMIDLIGDFLWVIFKGALMGNFHECYC